RPRDLRDRRQPPRPPEPRSRRDRRRMDDIVDRPARTAAPARRAGRAVRAVGHHLTQSCGRSFALARHRASPYVTDLDSSHGQFGVTRRSEPIFNVPAVVVALIAACVVVHLARAYVLTDDEDIEFLVTFAFIPARYSPVSVFNAELPGGWAADVWTFV